MGRRPNRRGVSVVELLIVLTIALLVVMGTALVLAQTSTMTWRRTDAQMTSATAAQQALNRITEDLRRADSSSFSATLSCQPDSLVLQPADGTPVVWYVRVQADVQGDPLLRVGNLLRLQGATRQVIAAGVTSFTPSGCAPGSHLVRIALTTSPSGPDDVSFPQTLVSQAWVPNP